MAEAARKSPPASNLDMVIGWLDDKAKEKNEAAISILCRVGPPVVKYLISAALKPDKRWQHLVASRGAGVSSLEMTMNVYAKATDKSKREAVAALPFTKVSTPAHIISMQNAHKVRTTDLKSPEDKVG